MNDTDAAKKIEQEKRLKSNMLNIKHKIIVMSGKGGVGKTTTSVNLATGLALKGHKVGILDVDIHGPNIAKMLGIEGKKLIGSAPGVDPLELPNGLKVISLSLLLDNPDQPIIWRGPLKMITIKQFLADVNWGVLDYLIIDSPPGTGDEPLSVCQLIENIDAAIIVTTPQDVAILDARKSVLFAKQLKIPFIGIIENMSGLICPHCKQEIELFGKNKAKQTAIDFGISFLGRIPLEPRIVRQSDIGEPFLKANIEDEATLNMNKIVSNISGYFNNEEEKV